MRKIVPLIFLVFLSGCFDSTVPVKRVFPDAPQEIKAACPDLNLLDENETRLSILLEVVTKNYSLYHECRVKMDAWIEWHKTQKEIFESVK